MRIHECHDRVTQVKGADDVRNAAHPGAGLGADPGRTPAAYPGNWTPPRT
ncbi:hypothetical protein [Streptomyces sp. TS71-3]|nr:hypothetical protein [Streptomyces sp. TS71-3]GHJ38430.1 hypothetical protein Sm713_40390 [Streptomyces sp. TS71-3]